MKFDIDFKYAKKFVNDISSEVDRAKKFEKDLKDNEHSNWMSFPSIYKEDMNFINMVAKDMKKRENLLIIGIGGSYLGSRAAIEFLEEDRGIFFLGNNLDSSTIIKTLNKLEGRDFSVNVISKSGSTLEPIISFGYVEDILKKRYPNSYSNRVYVTSEKGSYLHDIATREGYKFIELDKNMVGRYSVLSPVGLIPLSFKNIDVIKILEGASDALLNEKVYEYAAYRSLLYKKGYSIDVLATYNDSLFYLAEWWKQLFGESEGKDGKGLFPISLSFSRDLHSLGQYLQEGKKIFFETVLSFTNEKKLLLPNNYEGEFEYLKGIDMGSINRSATTSVAEAHYLGDSPIIQIEMEEQNEYSLGFLLYFFQKSCVLSSLLIGVNPYDNVGVNSYKNSLKKRLKEK